MSDLQAMAPADAVELYLQERESELAEKTLQSHEYRLREFVKWCRTNDIENLNDLTGRDLYQFRVDRKEDGDLELVSLEGQLSTLRVFLDHCESFDAVPEGLREKVMLPTVSEKEGASMSKLDYNRADDILDYVSRYEYASRRHLIFAILWRTGIRIGTLRAFDLRDINLEDFAIDANHRPETGTPLKNAERGERMIAIDDRLAQVIEDYIDGPRDDVTDDHGREPLVSTRHGRASESTIRDTIYRLTRPCMVGKDCPHDQDQDECEYTEFDHASKCPSSRSPHDMRSGAITAHLLEDVPSEIVSERMDVSQKVLDRHYDRRTKRERMEQRRKYLE